LERVWFWDDAYDAIIGRPGTRLAHFSATVIDDKVIDGAVMGTAVAVKASGGQLRRIQTGYVRHYAVAIVAGLLVIVAYLLSRSL
jgi:NADH-quinone oxidoreductase subunit L